MRDQTNPPSDAFDAREREFIRREFGVHFSQPSYLADGILLRTWRSGPERNEPKLPVAVRSMLGPRNSGSPAGTQRGSGLLHRRGPRGGAAARS